MKKLLVILLSFFSAVTLIGQDMKLDELLEKYLKVSGEYKFEKIQTCIIHGKLKKDEIFQMTSYWKRPDMERTEMNINGTTLIFVFTGKTGWMVNPVNKSMTPQDLNAEMVKYQSKMLGRGKVPFGWDNPILNWKEKGNRIVLVGKEDIDGVPVYNLQITFNDGEVANYYMDAEKFLIIKVIGKSVGEGVMEQEFSDYREVNGIMIPGNLETFNNGSSTVLLTFDSIKINVPIDDSKFRKPASGIK